MSWLTFTDADRRLANAFRIARFTMAIPTLQRGILHLDLENTLHIHTQSQADLSSLQLFSRDLQIQSYIILGVREVRLWHDKDLATEYSLESVADVIEHSQLTMTTATLDRPAAYQTSAPADKPSLPGQSLAAIAEDTQQDINEVRDWCRENGWAIIPFGNDEIIAGEAAIAALDWFGQILIQQRKAKRGLIGGDLPQPALTSATNGKVEAVAEPQPEISEPTPTPAKPTGRSLALANGFRNKAKKGNTKANLINALPAKEDYRNRYLDEIASGSEKGMAFLEKVVATVISRFGGDKDKLMAIYLSAAKKLHSEMSAKPAEA